MPTLPAVGNIIQRFRADTINVDGSGRVTSWPDLSASARDATPYAVGPMLIASDPTFARFPSIDFRRVSAGDPSLMLKANAATFGLQQGTYGVVYSLDAYRIDGDGWQTPFTQELLAGDDAHNCDGGIDWNPNNVDDPTLWVMYFGESFYYFGSPRGGDEWFGGAAVTFPFGPGMHDSLLVTPETPDTAMWYLDGGNMRTPTHFYGPHSPVLDCLTIGGRHGSLGDTTGDKTYWQGRIAEIVVWNRDLSSDEVATWEQYVQDRYVHGQPDVPVSYDVLTRDLSEPFVHASDLSTPAILARDLSGPFIHAADESGSAS